MKQEFTPPLFKAKRIGSNEWVEGGLIQYKGHGETFVNAIQVLNDSKEVLAVMTINPSTLCMDSGLTAEWVADGIDKKIWSGDLFEAETVAGIRTWKVIYKNAAFYVQRTDDEEIETLLFNFISDNVYTKIGSIHDKK